LSLKADKTLKRYFICACYS